MKRSASPVMVPIPWPRARSASFVRIPSPTFGGRSGRMAGLAAISDSPSLPSEKPTPRKNSTTCPVDPTKGCIECHMPSAWQQSTHSLKTDHYHPRPRSARSGEMMGYEWAWAFGPLATIDGRPTRTAPIATPTDTKR